ncbi:endonuclease domain-containing protein [Asanoa iriomotensis]|uniref:DUF559 domain-containing protein n=1 Tax=Asanoa iriomotensis TaxID=234613 RepID=A0ABQ4C7T3_9ACTN|nr:DUF559 domain-containing protein [Asanoa iriomotensis]GIF58833.1 hypothetical protein Air01nite_49280 [Asanoa iriomotensis]
MEQALATALATGGGVVRWTGARDATVPRWAIDNGLRSKTLVRLLPSVYADASCANEPAVRRRAALAYGAAGLSDGTSVGEGVSAVLSHTSALVVWGLLGDEPLEQEHITVARHSTARSRGWLVVHHPTDPPTAVMRNTTPVTLVERSLVDAWPWLPALDRQAPIINAVNDRLTTPQRLGDALAAAPKIPGRAELRGLVARLAVGCRSPLEIWGDDKVFTGPGMPPFARQFPVRLDGRTVYLDVFHEGTRVNFELDGAGTHGSPRQREVDLRRDAALAARGILVVRLSHARLTTEPQRVRREILAILRNRSDSTRSVGLVASP